MPGEPLGIPGTAMPAALGFWASSRLMSAAGTWPSTIIAADLGRVAAGQPVRHAQPLLDRHHVLGLDDLHREAMLFDMLDPLRAAAAIGRLVDGQLGRRWPRCRTNMAAQADRIRSRLRMSDPSVVKMNSQRSISPSHRELDRFGQRRLGPAGGEGGERVDRPPAILASAFQRVGQGTGFEDQAVAWARSSSLMRSPCIAAFQKARSSADPRA